MTVESRSGTTPSPVAQDTMIALGVSMQGGARFYSDAACASAVSSTLLRAGQSSAPFYMRPITGGVTLTITVTAPFGSDMVSLNARPVVKRGNCSFLAVAADGGEDLGAYCSFSPDLFDTSHAFVISTANSNTANGASEMIRCYLTSTTAVQCQRQRGLQAANIEWQVIELPYGVSTEHQLFTCSASPMLRTYGAVDAGASFVLRTNKTDGTDIDETQLVVARLISPTQVQVDFGVPLEPCSTSHYDLQLVDFEGVSVTRGVVDAGLPPGVASALVAGLPAVGPNTVLMVQPRAAPNAPLCTEMVRGDMPSPTSISFTRGAGDAFDCVLSPVLQLEWQRLDFGPRATVQTRQVSIPAGMFNGSATISAVDMSRTFVLTSEMANGNGGGETNFVGGYWGGEAFARVQLTSPTTVSFSRPRSQSLALFTLYVVQLEP
jgi:hypothetical protein